MSKKIDVVQAMAMNRHERRRVGKLNGVRIPGLLKPRKKGDGKR